MNMHTAKTYTQYYVERLINPINGEFTDEQNQDYDFMTTYLIRAFQLIPTERNHFLPEPDNTNFGIVSLGQPYWIKKYLDENKDDFFNKFYFYKGLNNL